MSVSAEYLVPRFSSLVGRRKVTDLSRDSQTTEASEVSSGRTRWVSAIFGAVVLYLFLVSMLFWSPVWLLVFAPFVLLSTGRLLGLRSLWNDGEHRRRHLE